MESFSEEVISEIKNSYTDSELNEIIGSSISRFKLKDPCNEGRYILNMIVSLQGTKAEQLPSHAMKNINLAIEIFRKYNKQIPDFSFKNSDSNDDI